MDLPEGYSERRAQASDIDAVAALTATVDTALGTDPTYRRGEILIDWNRPGFDIDLDTWMIERDGRPAAFGHLVPRGNSDLVLMMWVHPDHEVPALPGGLIPAMEERARVVAGASSYTRGIAVASEQETLLRSAIESQGFAPDALFVEMVCGLDGEAPQHSGPDGIVLRTYTADDAQRFYEVLVTAFSEHWGAGFPPFEEWLRDVTGLEDYDPYLSLVALEGDEMVGALFASLHGDLGEVHDVGVLPSHRGRGIGEALMLEIFDRFRSRAGRRARLWVDTQNVTDAIRLYERVGMSVNQRFHFYAKSLTTEGPSS